MGGSVERMTIRDNVFYTIPNADIQVGKDEDRDVSLHILGNKFWKGPESGTLQILDLSNIYALEIKENTFVYEGPGGGSRNITLFEIPTPSDWTIDGNGYWAPEISMPFKVTGDGGYSFTDWQVMGYDTNSVHVDPGFADPSNGVF